jgi:hypothetical protein
MVRKLKQKIDFTDRLPAEATANAPRTTTPRHDGQLWRNGAETGASERQRISLNAKESLLSRFGRAQP